MDKKLDQLWKVYEDAFPKMAQLQDSVAECLAAHTKILSVQSGLSDDNVRPLFLLLTLQ